MFLVVLLFLFCLFIFFCLQRSTLSHCSSSFLITFPVVILVNTVNLVKFIGLVQHGKNILHPTRTITKSDILLVLGMCSPPKSEVAGSNLFLVINEESLSCVCK